MQTVDRRGFLNWLGLAGIAPLMGLPTAHAAGGVRQREIVLLETFVAGFQFHDGIKPEVFGRLESGVKLTLNRERQNPYDRNAIAVRTTSGSHIGFIPKAENQMLARMMDQQVPVYADIATAKADMPTWERVAIRVFLNIPDGNVAETTVAV